jgi:glycosyltransferase involved in cell wall biosynthesis
VPTDTSCLDQVAQLQQEGKLVVYETDDDYTNSSRVSTKPQHLDLVEEVWRTVDAITVSTPHLKKIMLAYNPNVSVLPNCWTRDLWEPARDFRKVDGLTIGLVGGDSHYEDWKIPYPALLKIAGKYPEVRFFFGGYMPAYYEDLPRTVYQPGVPCVAFPGVVRQVDIGLAPVASDDEFNLSKSAQKLLDYWSSVRQDGKHEIGCAVIASDHPIYRRVATPKTAILVDDNGWEQAIASLLQDSHLRKSLGKNGLKWVRKHRDLSTQWKLWASFYRNLWRRRNERIK